MTSPPAVVLAGGEGRRLRPLTVHRPKPMLPAANRPILDHVLDTLTDLGVSELHLVVGYGRERVQSHVGPRHRNTDVHYHVQGKQLGSGHALLQAADALDEPFLVLNGDQLVEPGIVADVISAADEGPGPEDNDTAADRADAVLAVVESEAASRYGAVELDGDRVTALLEGTAGPDARLLNAGVYHLRPSIFEVLGETPLEDGSISLPAALSTLIDDGTVRAARTEGAWIDATYPWDLLAVAAGVLELGWIDEPARTEGVYVAESASVHEDATLVAPVVVGRQCEVEAGAVLGPTVALGPGGTVEANAVCTNSIIDEGGRVGAGAVLRDAVLGQDVAVGANATVGGGRADVRIEDRIVEDCRLGAVLADRVDLGAGATVSPGRLVGPAATVGDGVVLQRDVPEGAEVRS